MAILLCKMKKACNKLIYNIPSKVYLVELLLALGNMFCFTKSIFAHSHDKAKNLYETWKNWFLALSHIYIVIMLFD